MLLTLLVATTGVVSAQDRSDTVEPTAERQLQEAEAFRDKFDQQQFEAFWADEIRRWSLSIYEPEQFLESGDRDPERLKRYEAITKNVGAEAQEAIARVERHITTEQRLLDALGNRPDKEQPPEPEEVASQRNKLELRLRTLQSSLSLIRLTNTRADNILHSLENLEKQNLLQELETRTTRISPFILIETVPELGGMLVDLTQLPFQWYRQSSVEHRPSIQPAVLIFALVISVALATYVRSIVNRKYGKNENVPQPSYSRRLISAAAEGLTRGIIPSVILLALIIYPTQYIEGGLSALLQGASIFSALLYELLFLGLGFFIGSALIHGLLSPDHPSWRLLSMSKSGSRALGRRLIIILLILLLGRFLGEMLTIAEASQTLMGVQQILYLSMLALGVLSLCARSLWWENHEEEEEDSGPEDQEGWWRYPRLLATILSVTALVSALLGYVGLAGYLLYSMLSSAAVTLIYFVIKNLFRELVRYLTELRFLRRQFKWRIITLKRIKTWSNLAINLVLLVMLAGIVLNIWGIPRTDLLLWADKAFNGLQIGSITLSIRNIVLAVFAFFLIISLTRLAQRTILERTLESSSLDIGARYSINVGISYLGITLAALFAVGVLGLSFTHVALVAGALSLGIGFGLQNVVDNFVSGLVLLIERPIKIGDWVSLSEHEGYVKRINFRSTELETFTRASIIIPNSELISKPVTNMTLKDSFGRVDVEISVAYDSDPKLVERTLTEIATSHPRIMESPAPFVLFRSFGDSALEFELRGFIADVAYRPMVASEIRYEIMQQFRSLGIEIPFPQRVVHINKENESPG